MNFAENLNIGEPTTAGGLKVFPLYFAVSRTSADPELRSSRVSAPVRGQPLQDLTWDMVATRRTSAGIADGGGSLLDVEEREDDGRGRAPAGGVRQGRRDRAVLEGRVVHASLFAA